MLQRKCLNDLSCNHWKKSWHGCSTSSTVILPEQQQHLKRPHQIKKRKGTCRNRFCWVRITKQHRVLTRNNSLLRRRPSVLTPPLSSSMQQERRRYKTRRRSLHHLHFIQHDQKSSIHTFKNHHDLSCTLSSSQQHDLKKENHDSNNNNTSNCCCYCCRYHKKKSHHQDVEITEEEEEAAPMVLQNAWTPPITAETLQELALGQIMNNIQLRHDLLFDRNLCFRPNFDGASGKAKQRKAERYWVRLERAFQHENNYDCFLPILLDQIIESLALIYCAKETTTSTCTCNQHYSIWPRDITMDTVRSMFNPDLILREISNDTLDLNNKVRFIVSVLKPMCPPEHIPRIQLLVIYFEEKSFAKAFRQCFAVLEAIQLDQANRFLREQRNYLIQTCAQYERQQVEQQCKDWYLIERWLSQSRDYPDWTFLRVYHTAIVRLITMEYTPFPYTLQYDQYRLVHQFRTEFIYITTLAILLIPYYYLVGPWWNKTDLQTLKLKLAKGLKRTGIQNYYSYHHHQQASSTFYYTFAMYCCEAAMTTHARRQGKTMHHVNQPKLNDQEQYDIEKWMDWLKRHLNASSEIYQMMHDRVFHVLRRVSQGQLQHHDFNHNTLIALDRELLALGLRIRAVADLNLATYGTCYQQLWHKMTNNFKF